MSLTQVIYTSRPFGFDGATLSGILIAARHFNSRDGITGALICRDDIFLQLLEGPTVLVQAAYNRIERDDRHIEVVPLFNGEVAARLFPDWDMLHDPARSWLWTPDQIEAGAVRNATHAELIAVFKRVAAEPAESAQIS
jgi:hypothetical protein